MKITAEPRSDQINAEDLIGGAETYIIAGVIEGKAEQKYDIQLQGQNRVWRPPLTVLRVLIKCWGNEADEWTGRRVTLYCDESVTFGKETVGGIRISHLSHIDKPMEVSVTASRGRRQKIKVQPLKESAPQPDPIEQSLRDAWNDVDRLQKAVKWMADNQHPLHQKAADRLAEIQETGEVEE